MANDPANQRLLIRGAGVAGQVHYIPWLIRLMSDDATARLSGESFSTITGLDLRVFGEQFTQLWKSVRGN